MKYLIISDIHGCLPTLQKALTFYREQHCDMLLILGDILNYGPRNTLPEGLNPKGIAETLNDMSADLAAIRGNCDSEVDQMLLHFDIMQTSMLLIDCGCKILLTHGHIYNKENMPTGKYDAIIYGHTHLWELSAAADGTTICNTGSITFPKGGKQPTMVTLQNGILSIFSLEGDKLSEKRIK
jgi:putative phosphoesterase